jgi:mannose-1-phosphate guanylyltransferase
MDLTAQLRSHEEKSAVATLALIAVEDTSSYGVVPTDEEGRVEAFLEKSAGPAPTDRVNAGAYVLEREVIELIPPGQAVSFEREIFPRLVGRGLYGYPQSGYWVDIGTPDRYLDATYDLLAGRVESDLPPRDETSSLIYDGSITSGARIGPLSVVGRRCVVGAGAHVEQAVLHDEVRVGEECVVTEAVLGRGVQVEEGARVLPGAMVGAEATVAAGAQVAEDARVEPGERVG